jgi:Rod binding domain-containing protein
MSGLEALGNQGVGGRDVLAPVSASRALTRGFDAVLRELQGEGSNHRSETGATKATGEAEGDRAVEAARSFVSTALVEPILKQLRETNEAWGPFKPGKHEAQFRSMLDARIAERVVSASEWPLVERLARDLRSRSETGDASSPAR